MDREMKVILRNNIIKFIIGIILLTVSYWYLQNHPAEKASIFSGFQVLVQKVEVLFFQITNKNTEGLKLKFDYEKNFNELISTAKNNSCVQSNILDEITETYSLLRKERVSNIENNLSTYQRKFVEYKKMIDNACKN